MEVMCFSFPNEEIQTGRGYVPGLRAYHRSWIYESGSDQVVFTAYDLYSVLLYHLVYGNLFHYRCDTHEYFKMIVKIVQLNYITSE